MVNYEYQNTPHNYQVNLENATTEMILVMSELK